MQPAAVWVSSTEVTISCHEHAACINSGPDEQPKSDHEVPRYAARMGGEQQECKQQPTQRETASCQSTAAECAVGRCTA